MANSPFGQSVQEKMPKVTETPVKSHLNGSQQARAHERKAEKAVQKTEAAMECTVKPQKEQKFFQLFERPQPKVRDYVVMARIKASKLSPAQVIPGEFFHQEGQYKFDDFVKALRSYNVELFKHLSENKVKICFKGVDSVVHIDDGWIDIPHGAQKEMGQSAGWFLRIKQFLEKHGAIEKKQAKEAKKE